MRKLMLLALGLGLAEIVRREAAKRGISRTDYLTNFASNTIAHLKGEESDLMPRFFIESARN
jgi:hypothetical protein